MERIVIEVDEATARSWQEASPKVKEQFGKEIKDFLERIAHEINVAEFEELLDRVSDEAARNGLTEEILEKLLNDE